MRPLEKQWLRLHDAFRPGDNFPLSDVVRPLFDVAPHFLIAWDNDIEWQEIIMDQS